MAAFLVGFPLQVDPQEVKPGWIGLFVVIGLGVAMVLLWRSMNKQLRKVDFDERAAAGEPDEGPPDPRTRDERGSAPA